MNEFWTGLSIGMGLCVLGGAGAGVFVSRRRRRQLAHERQMARLAELGAISDGLMHELKNPLSTIQLNIQLLQEDLPVGHPAFDRFSKGLTDLKRETARLKEILDGFRQYAGNMSLGREMTDIGRLLEDLADFLTPQAQLGRVSILFQQPETPVMALVDPALLKQAVLNLMLNAMQAMPDGGELMLRASRLGSRAIIEVTDTGAGIPEEVRPKLFSAYFSTKKGGTGLGLALVRRIMQEHGGDITFISDVGKGTRFTLTLPAQ